MIGAHSYHLISAHLMCLHYVHACRYCTIPATHTISKVLHHHKFCIIASSQVLLGTLTSFVWEQKSLSFHISIWRRGIVVETEEQYFSGNAFKVYCTWDRSSIWHFTCVLLKLHIHLYFKHHYPYGKHDGNFGEKHVLEATYVGRKKIIQFEEQGLQYIFSFYYSCIDRMHRTLCIFLLMANCE